MMVKFDTLGASYDGLEDGKKIFMDDMNQKPAWIATELDPKEEIICIATLKD